MAKKHLYKMKGCSKSRKKRNVQRGGTCGGTCSSSLMMGGFMKHRKQTKSKRSKRNKSKISGRKYLTGGSNFLTQDLVNVGRLTGFGANSAYSGLIGKMSPLNPLPWKDQLTQVTPLQITSLKIN